MDQDWRVLATQRAEYVSDRIRGLLSSGLDFLQAELGLDLGIKPEQYPTWLILSAALIGLTVLLLIAACGRRKRRVAPVPASPSTAVAEAPVKAAVPPKAVKTEPSEPKKKNKKKAAEKKAQANGQTVAGPQEEIKVTEEKKKPPPAPARAPAPAPAQPPADTKTKKNKKKPKPEVKPTQDVSSTNGKEPDEGAWETKVSNREKRQQRKKEKGPGDSSGSPESGDRASPKVEQPAVTAPASTKKNKESSRAKASKGDTIIHQVSSNWNDVNSVNGGGWTQVPVKSTQSNVLNNELSAGRKTPGHKNRENATWKQESEGPWTGLDGRIKAEPNAVKLKILGLNPSGSNFYSCGETRTKSNSEIGQRDREPTFDSQWTGLNGVANEGMSSDWNAPTEVWDNYEQPKVDPPTLKEMPVSKPLVDSNDDNDKVDPAGGGKSKRRKKKKRPEEDGSAAEVTQVGSAPAEKSATVKPHPPHVPKDERSKQNVPPQSSQKKSDQNWEPPKQVQKKKARRET
ncbi:metadherin a isoform X4 [Onychostoma macrolepis]|uniref:metadherin a isoform X4 n=1 Tax=Onychostoma macrolepis TaxID=369639 RepID=UPI00272DAF71|nr:metadherin a isoform X4 [Onychostoma macrolepis]